MTTQQTDAGMAALLGRFRADAGAGAAGYATAAAQGDDAGDAALARVSLAGRIEAHLGTIGRELELERNRRARELARRLQAIDPVWLPPVPYSVTAGAAVLDASRSSSADFGPQDGYAWFVTHLAVAGLQRELGGNPGTTLNSEATVTNPAALTNFGNISAANVVANSPVGTVLNIQWSVSMQGTVAAGDANNVRLVHNSITRENALYPAVVGNYPQLPVQLVEANSNITAQVINAASGASAIYGVQIAVTPLAGADDTVSLYKYSTTGLNNYLHTFTASNPDWSLGSSSFFLLPDDYLTLSGSGLLASQIALTGQAIQVALPVLADYLM